MKSSRPSIRLSVRPSLSFLKIGSLVFSDIVHDDSWPWYLVTDGTRFLKKKKLQSKFEPNGPKSGPKLGFLYFLKFHSLFFLEIACNNSLQQCLTSSRGKIYVKFLWPKFGPKGPIYVRKLDFLTFSQNWFISFPWNFMQW